MLLFPGQAVHCHLFMRLFCPPLLHLFSPNTKYGNCVSQFVHVYTQTHTYACISIHVPLYRDLLMSVSFTAVNANLCCTPWWMRWTREGPVNPAEKLFRPPSIITLPHPLVLAVIHGASHIISVSRWLSYPSEDTG